ncbi:hypothetical protein [Streptomyces niveus]|uniref:hypothetical protein n=1 Tax=Streptomyces niveus TaxID=193462 RepID=UPI0037AFAD2C
MSSARNRVIRGSVLGAAILTLAVTAPALAEGSWSSYISDWGTGNESRRWTDRNSDSVSTSVGFGGCSASPTSFRSVTLAVYKDVLGPDDNKGNKDNTCSTNSWGDLASGEYYFGVELINQNATGFKFSANSVLVKY